MKPEDWAEFLADDIEGAKVLRHNTDYYRALDQVWANKIFRQVLLREIVDLKRQLESISENLPHDQQVNIYHTLKGGLRELRWVFTMLNIAKKGLNKELEKQEKGQSNG